MTAFKLARPLNLSLTGSASVSGDISLDWLASMLSGMAAGDWLDVSAETNVEAITDTNPAAETAAWLESRVSRPIVNWPGNATHDSARNRVVFTGASNGFSSESPSGTHSATTEFDLATGLFSKVWAPLGLANLGHQYDGNMARPHGNYVYRRPYNADGYSDPPIYRCDLTTDTWTVLKEFAAAPAGYSPSLCFFPTLGTTGSIIIAGSSGSVWRYDLTGDSITQIATSSGSNTANEMVCEYHPGADVVVYGAEELYTLDNTGTTAYLTDVASTGMSGFGPLYSNTILPDPEGGSVAYVVDNVTTEKMFSLNLSTGALTQVVTTPAGFTESAVGACLADAGALIFFEGKGRASSTVSLDKVWLYKVV